MYRICDDFLRVRVLASEELKLEVGGRQVIYLGANHSLEAAVTSHTAPLHHLAFNYVRRGVCSRSPTLGDPAFFFHLASNLSSRGLQTRPLYPLIQVRKERHNAAKFKAINFIPGWYPSFILIPNTKSMTLTI